MLKTKTIIITLKLLLSFVLVWYLLQDMDFSSLSERLKSLSPIMLVGALIAAFLQILFGAVRWKIILDAIGAFLPFGKIMRFYYTGVFFNQVLPTSVGGDAVRIFQSHRAGMKGGKAINSVFLDRISAFMALIILVTVVTPFFLQRVALDAGVWIPSFVSILFLVGVGGFVLLIMLDRLPKSLHRWRILKGTAHLAVDARHVFLIPAFSFRVILLSVLGQVCISICVYALALGLGLEVFLIDCLALVPLTLLVMTAPISIAGWGVRESAMVMGFGLVGIAAEGAFVLSILFGLTIVVVSLPGGIVWLLAGPSLDADVLEHEISKT